MIETCTNNTTKTKSVYVYISTRNYGGQPGGSSGMSLVWRCFSSRCTTERRGTDCAFSSDAITDTFSFTSCTRNQIHVYVILDLRVWLFVCIYCVCKHYVFVQACGCECVRRMITKCKKTYMGKIGTWHIHSGAGLRDGVGQRTWRLRDNVRRHSVFVGHYKIKNKKR